jgi:predicted MFS family arabinose efflux permease
MGNPSMKSRVNATLAVLFAINTLNFFDRNILSSVTQQIKRDFDLSDAALGGLGTAFTLLYAAVGIPFGRWADSGRRTRILSIGVTIWSVLTAASGWAWNYWSLFVFRLGVGVGEASCAPAATSLIGDLVPPTRRSAANAVFMLGLPAGLALSYWLGGDIGQRWGWRATLYLAGAPGLIVGLIAWFLPEPERTGTHSAHEARSGEWLRLLRNPIMILLIASGAVHNYNMYTVNFFNPSYLQRFHEVSTMTAGRISAISFGFGGLGILIGGWLCDRLAAGRPGGRMEVSCLAIFLSVPCYYLAFQAPAGNYVSFATWLLLAYFLSCIYYPGVYATIQDITPPRQRGTAMAIYFCAMYFFGASLGTYVTGFLSDRFAASAKAAGASTEMASAVGLRSALYQLPILAFVLAIVLFAAGRLVARQLATARADGEGRQV